jgi:hypothetical protein
MPATTADGNGGGSDRLFYGNSPEGVVVNLADGTAEDGFGTTDTFTGINGVDGSEFDGELEFFRPRSGDNLVEGSAGIDRIDYRNNATAVGSICAPAPPMTGSTGIGLQF